MRSTSLRNRLIQIRHRNCGMEYLGSANILYPAGNQGTDCVGRQRILLYRGDSIFSLSNASILSCSVTTRPDEEERNTLRRIEEYPSVYRSKTRQHLSCFYITT